MDITNKSQYIVVVVVIISKVFFDLIIFMNSLLICISFDIMIIIICVTIL